MIHPGGDEFTFRGDDDVWVFMTLGVMSLICISTGKTEGLIYVVTQYMM